MLFNRIDNPIGLDISELSVKQAEIKRTRLGLKLSKFRDNDLPAGLIQDYSIVNPQGLSDFLRSTVKPGSIVASVPESKSFVRVITTPKLMPDELATAVPLEAEQYIPLPMDQMLVDWQVVGEKDDGLHVLITATPKDYVAQLVEVLERANLKVAAIEVESSAITRCVVPWQKVETPAVLILDMNASRTTLIIHSGGSVQFTTSIPMAGNALTSAISQRLKISPEEAEKIKRFHGIPSHYHQTQVSKEGADSLSDIQLALEPVLNNIYDEVKNTIKFHEDHSLNQAGDSIFVKQIFLCGGTSKLPGISDWLQAKVIQDDYFGKRQIKVSLSDSLVNFTHAGPPPFSQKEALSYTTAIGLALRNYV